MRRTKVAGTSVTSSISVALCLQDEHLVNNIIHHVLYILIGVIIDIEVRRGRVVIASSILVKMMRSRMMKFLHYLTGR
jgi:hypothetical protein